MKRNNAQKHIEQCLAHSSCTMNVSCWYFLKFLLVFQDGLNCVQDHSVPELAKLLESFRPGY